MGGLYGAPRVLQSIASGNNFPAPLSYLSIGVRANLYAYVDHQIIDLKLKCYSDDAIDLTCIHVDGLWL